MYINNVGMCLRARLYNYTSIIDVLHASLVQMYIILQMSSLVKSGYVPIALWQAHADLLWLELFDSLKRWFHNITYSYDST